ncbi:protein starmaker-like, partial [Centroberyx affinis]|uniref:protein starmaker-like n=1 Tax=Centroberyx affinis TaxID=166261 RepID=UPI003A5C4367
EVAEPSISCVINDTSGSDASEVQARLLCSAEPRGPPSLVKFDWWLLEGPQPGRELSISLGGKHDDAVYRCGVSNPVSGKNATFTANTCYPDKVLLTALIVCIVIFCILLLILVGIYCYWKRYKARTVQRERTDVENQSAHAPAEGVTHVRQSITDEKTNENGGSPDGQTAVKPDETPMPGSENKSDEDQEKQPLLDNGATLPSTQPLALLARHDQNTEPEDNASEHEEEDADSDQAAVETTEEKLPQTDSSSFEKRNETASVGEPEQSSEEKESDLLSSSTPEQPGLKTTPEPDSNLSHEEPNAQPDATESNQQEMDRPVSEHENESDTESDLEGVSEASNLPLRSPQQPQSPTQTIPDNTNNTSTFQEQADPDLEEPSLDSCVDPNMTNPEQKSETKSDSDESGGHSQTDLYTAEQVEGASQHELQPADEKHEAQSGPNTEEPGEERLSEDEKELVKPSESEIAVEEKYEEEAHSESEAANVMERETKMETI